MKRLLALALLPLLAVGCARLSSNHKVVSAGFRDDPLDHKAEEAIEQIEIVAPSAVVHRVGKVPTDWTVGVRGQSGKSVTCVTDPGIVGGDDVAISVKSKTASVPLGNRGSPRFREG